MSQSIAATIITMRLAKEMLKDEEVREIQDRAFQVSMRFRIWQSLVTSQIAIAERSGNWLFNRWMVVSGDLGTTVFGFSRSQALERFRDAMNARLEGVFIWDEDAPSVEGELHWKELPL